MGDLQKISSDETASETPPDQVADKREITGWYIYDVAVSPFFTTAMQFLPLLITGEK